MRKALFIALALLLGALIWNRGLARRPASGVALAPPVSPVRVSEPLEAAPALAESPASSSGTPADQTGVPPEPAAAEALAQPARSPARASAFEEPASPSPAAQSAPAEWRKIEEAVVVQEEQDGSIVVQADPSTSPDPQDRALHLKEVVQNSPDTASGQLLGLFQSASDPDARQDILSAASLLPSDQNTRLLWQSALGLGQPEELRFAAIGYAAEREPDLLLSPLQSSNEPFRSEIESLFDDPVPPDESRVIGTTPRPLPQNLVYSAPAASQ